MSTTIFCNFEQQDLADLAVGRLRASSLAIRSIHYIGGFKPERERTGAINGTAFWGFGGTTDLQSQSSAPVAGFVRAADDPPMPSPPVTLKIVCADSSAAAVKSKLINMNAYQIITTR